MSEQEKQFGALNPHSPEQNETQSPVEEEKGEPVPEKVVLLIRHPSPAWGNRSAASGEYQQRLIDQGKAAATPDLPVTIPGNYVPPDREGLAMARHLADYLPTHLNGLAGVLEPDIENPSLDRHYIVRSSPMRRARDEAELVTSRMRLQHTEDTTIALPQNRELILDWHFAELPWAESMEEHEAIMARSKELGKDELALRLEEEPDRTIGDMNQKLHELQDGLDELGGNEVPVDIIFTHRLLTALLLWAIEHQTEEGRLPTEVTREDLVKIHDSVKHIAFTSINEIRKVKGRWKVQSIGQTPHLDDTDLRRASVLNT